MNLPSEIVEEILVRLPVKLLLQLRILCKSWNSLISDNSKFAKKHFLLSTRSNLCFLSRSKYFPNPQFILQSYPYPLDSLSTDVTNIADINTLGPCFYVVGTCHGILCFATDYKQFFVVKLCNPSIRKFKDLPPLLMSQPYHTNIMYGFGYDSVSDKYKVVVLYHRVVSIHQVNVYTASTNYWKTISVSFFNFSPLETLGKFVSSTINWLVIKDKDNRKCIVSFDLGSGSFQEVFLPDNCQYRSGLCLCVFKDCLCWICGDDVWVMKEYGNKDSWTKLFTISYMQHPTISSPVNVIYIFEDAQVLRDSTCKFIYYNRKNGTFKFIECHETPEVIVESLISPCF